MGQSPDSRNKDKAASKPEKRQPQGSAKNQKQGDSARHQARKTGTGSRDARGKR